MPVASGSADNVLDGVPNAGLKARLDAQGFKDEQR